MFTEDAVWVSHSPLRKKCLKEHLFTRVLWARAKNTAGRLHRPLTPFQQKISPVVTPKTMNLGSMWLIWFGD